MFFPDLFLVLFPFSNELNVSGSLQAKSTHTCGFLMCNNGEKLRVLQYYTFFFKYGAMFFRSPYYYRTISQFAFIDHYLQDDRRHMLVESAIISLFFIYFSVDEHVASVTYQRNQCFHGNGLKQCHANAMTAITYQLTPDF